MLCQQHLRDFLFLTNCNLFWSPYSMSSCYQFIALDRKKCWQNSSTRSHWIGHFGWLSCHGTSNNLVPLHSGIQCPFMAICSYGKYINYSWIISNWLKFTLINSSEGLRLLSGNTLTFWGTSTPFDHDILHSRIGYFLPHKVTSFFHQELIYFLTLAVSPLLHANTLGLIFHWNVTYSLCLPTFSTWG